MYVFTMPAEEWNEQNPDKQAILHLIRKHSASVSRLIKLKKYYAGRHDILEDDKRENKLVCNHAKDIADTASSYFIGNPITYKCKSDITPLTDALELAGADEADGDNGLDLSIYGRAYEYIYTKESETDLAIKNLPPEHTFLVYDDSIEQRELFAVYYYAKKDDRTESHTYVATILTNNFKYVLNIQDIDSPQVLIEEPEPHFKGEVPVIEYLNNKLAIGDYELQIPLIDAYNALMSDRITDKEQFIDAILAIYGTLLVDDDGDEVEDGQDTNGQKAMKKLKKEGLLEMPDGTKAEYLTRTFDEAGVEILKKAVEQDIHKFSHIPCMTDESFGGNVSGVAMEFKLLGIENITKIKTRYYRKGIRKRLRIFAYFLNTRSGYGIDVTGITPTFTRALPKNLLEISQIVANLWGKVSKKTLLSQIPFVDDVEEELKAVEKEAQEAVEQQQAMFGIGTNTPPPDEGESSEEEKQGKDVDEKQIDTVLRMNWSGKHYSERIWNNTQQLAEKTQEEILLSLLTGKTEREASESISRTFASGAAQSRRLIRTESNHVSTEMNFRAYEEAEIAKYRYLATLDLKTSKVCRELDGKTFPVRDRQTGVNAPPMHPWCRSTTVAVIDDDTLEGLTRSARDPKTGKTIKVPRSMTYHEWYEKYVNGDPEAELNAGEATPAR